VPISFQVILNAVWTSRLQLFAVVVILGLLSVGQGNELSLSQQGAIQYGSFLAIASVAVFALQLWIWTYVSVLVAPLRSYRFGPWTSEKEAAADPRLARSAAWVAGVYSGAVLLFVIYEFLRIGQATAALFVAVTNTILVWYVLYVGNLAGSDGSASTSLFRSLPAVFERLPLGLGRFRRLNAFAALLACLSLMLSPAAYLAWYRLPSEYAFIIGSFGCVFLALSLLSPWLFLIFVLAQGLRLPVATLLILSPFLAQTVYSYFGLHSAYYEVRKFESELKERPSIQKAALRWDAQATPRRPIVFVTAAGGGIRAAYWTASVLGRLEDCIPEFHKSLFSISSVSGGSLGAAAFVTLMASRTKKPPVVAGCNQPIPIDDDARIDGYHQDFLREFFSQDYLAPVLREMLLGDFPRALNPFTTKQAGVADRGIALEQAWERAWQNTCKEHERTCSHVTSFSTSFSALSRQSEWFPLLFLNGVHEETGKRLVTSTAHVVAETFPDATDFFDLVKHDVRTSTAVLNSARFPIISPSGTLLRTERRPSSSESKRPVGHVIDGGYFDNNGTVTSQEVAIASLQAVRAGQTNQACENSPGRRSVFIEILNDTSLTELDSERDDMKNDYTLADYIRELESLDQTPLFDQLLVAVRGLESSRAARAVYSSKSLARFARSACGGHYFVIPLCRGIVPQPALGWMLSEESRSAIDHTLIGGINSDGGKQSALRADFVDCYLHVQRTIGQIVDLLSG
jgi:hypothetical protein